MSSMACMAPTESSPQTAVGPSDPAGESPQLRALVTLVGEVLGPDLVGAYVDGSAVLGGQVRTSDPDLFAVCGAGWLPVSGRASSSSS